jgi:hypothetical protein
MSSALDTDDAKTKPPPLKKTPVAEKGEVEADQTADHPVLRRNGWIRFWSVVANYLGYKKLTHLTGCEYSLSIFRLHPCSPVIFLEPWPVLTSRDWIV